MPSRYRIFDVERLNILPLFSREHGMGISDVLEVGQTGDEFAHEDLPAIAEAVIQARRRGAPVILMMGAHVIKRGLSRYVIDFIRRGWVSTLTCNGACAIHDYELARIGSTTESVARYIREGQFGLWSETGELNGIVTGGDAEGKGYGEAVGEFIAKSDYPHKDISIFAAAWEHGVPATVHLGIGYDINHEHPSFDPAAAGRATYRDFLILAGIIEQIQGGVVLCFGTAVMGPEVFLKALAMARNVVGEQGRGIHSFTTAVFDLKHLTGDIHAEPPRDQPEYYYRPYKTLLVRTVGPGGRSFYVRGDHAATIPALHALLDKIGQ